MPNHASFFLEYEKMHFQLYKEDILELLHCQEVVKRLNQNYQDYLRESDRNREPGALVGTLHENYHKYSGSLLGYGIAMEDCFEEGAADGPSLRKRQWIRNMSALMKEMDTSMGLSFSLERKAWSAEGEQKLRHPVLKKTAEKIREWKRAGYQEMLLREMAQDMKR